MTPERVALRPARQQCECVGTCVSMLDKLQARRKFYDRGNQPVCVRAGRLSGMDGTSTLLDAVCVCVVCAHMNPSGNDSEVTGPVGLVRRCHFQVPVLFFFAVPLWGFTIHGKPFWCLLLMHSPPSRKKKLC